MSTFRQRYESSQSVAMSKLRHFLSVILVIIWLIVTIFWILIWVVYNQKYGRIS